MTFVYYLLPLRSFENLGTDLKICRIKQTFQKVLVAFMDFLLDQQWTALSAHCPSWNRLFFQWPWTLIFTRLKESPRKHHINATWQSGQQPFEYEPRSSSNKGKIVLIRK